MSHKFQSYKVILTDKLKTFSLLRPPRPDFMKEDVELIELKLVSSDDSAEPFYTLQAVFTNIPGEMAKKYRWVMDYDEYRLLATSVFCLRFPEHPYTKNHQKLAELLSKEEMLAFARGELQLKFNSPLRSKATLIKRYLRWLWNSFTSLLLLLMVPVGVYYFLHFKVGASQKHAIIGSIVFYACWLIAPRFAPYFEMPLPELFKVIKKKIRKNRK